MATKIKNEISLMAFCAMLGAFAGAILWCFLKLVEVGTDLIWEALPNLIGEISYYPIVICTIGGLIIGIFRKIVGDYPDSMMQVMGIVKTTGTYDYSKIIILIVAALLPLIFGASVGPEAGMVGVIVALGCWVTENVKYAGKNAKLYSKVGMAVSLSVLFHSPLFGLFSAEEDGVNLNDEAEAGASSKKDNILIYSIALAASFGAVKLLNTIFGEVSEGLPSFDTALPKGSDFLMMFVYIIAGILLGLFFEKTEQGLEHVATKVPAICKELIAGLLLGVAITFVPAVKFSGEHQMGVLIAEYAKYTPLAMIGLALLKILVTNLCIQFGLKGGHFFPLIFASVLLGYGISLMIYPLDGVHAVFAAAVTAAATLGITMKKPIAVTCLLFLCFPVRMSIWLFLAAAISSRIGSTIEKRSV